ADPDARPIRKGKLGRPNEFGYVAQLCELTENTRPGARGFILPAAHAPGNPGENVLLPLTAHELRRAGIKLRELVADGGFQWGPTSQTLPELTAEQIQLAHQHEPGSRRTRRRRARFRTGIEGRISHLKRRYGLRRSRLKGHRDEDLGRLGDPRLRPRHPRHPNAVRKLAGTPARTPPRAPHA